MTATIYTTDTCVYCPVVTRFLEGRGVEVTKVDVTDDLDTRNELQRLTGFQTVPITHINGEYLVGWNPARFMKALA